MKRRQFLYRVAAAGTGAAILPNIWGCSKEDGTQIIPANQDNQAFFKYLEASGSHYEVGKQIGSHFSKEIQSSRMALRDLLNAINDIIKSNPDVFYTPFLEASQNYFPDYIDELQGIADGSGLSFQDIFSSNIFMEVYYLYYELSGKKAVQLPDNLGCSTLAYSKDGKLFLAHNEDLFTSFLNSMYLVKLSVKGKPDILGLSYPGMLMGVPPSMNEAGIVQSGNDISGLHIEPSVPAAFHFRSVMDAQNLDDAIARASIPQRAKTMTHNIGSFTEKRIVSIEAAPEVRSQKEISGMYVHTNHFIGDATKDIAQDENNFPSSYSRFDTLSSSSAPYSHKPYELNAAVCTKLMSSHEGTYMPCVHDQNGSSTLAHTVFDFQEKNWKLYYSNPCLGRAKKYESF